MASAVDIANAALAKIGVSPLNSLDDTGETARVIKARFYDVLDSVIQDYPWNFAIKREELAKSPTDPESEWLYKYALPSDCLQVLEEVNGYDFVREEENFVLSNGESFDLLYTKRIEDMSELPPYFREALAYMLAGEVCYTLTGDIDNLDRITQKAEVWMRRAKLRDAQEGTPDKLKTGSWVNIRRNIRRS